MQETEEGEGAPMPGVPPLPITPKKLEELKPVMLVQTTHKKY